MKNKNLIIALLSILCIGLLWYINTSSKTEIVQTIPDIQKNPAKEEIKAENTQVSESEIPQKAYQIRNYIRQFNAAPPQHVGGRTFQNRERLLPQTDKNGIKIVYREWDVNPKKKGVNRGAERLITGSDLSAYYTADHYQSFKKLSP